MAYALGFSKYIFFFAETVSKVFYIATSESIVQLLVWYIQSKVNQNKIELPSFKIEIHLFIYLFKL